MLTMIIMMLIVTMMIMTMIVTLIVMIMMLLFMTAATVETDVYSIPKWQTTKPSMEYELA